MSKIDILDTSEGEFCLEEVNPLTKLERRRKIEDLHEEKRLREELGDYELFL